MPTIEHQLEFELSPRSSRKVRVIVEEVDPSIEEIVTSLKRERDLTETIRNLARKSADDVRNALSGKDTDLDNFWFNNLTPVDELTARVLKENITTQVIFDEAFSALQSEPRGNISPRLARDMAGFLTDSIASHAANN